MKLEIAATHTLVVTTEELRLICKALGGRLRSEEEISEAAHLDREIAIQRVAYAEHLNDEMQKLNRNLQSATKQ